MPTISREVKRKPKVYLNQHVNCSHDHAVGKKKNAEKPIETAVLKQ